jgi:hypothetical protein
LLSYIRKRRFMQASPRPCGERGRVRGMAVRSSSEIPNKGFFGCNSDKGPLSFSRSN